jgi:hypothetical protein
MRHNCYLLLSTLLASSTVFADCLVQQTSLPITCEETATLLQTLPSQHEQITAQSQVETINALPIFSSNRELESITIDIDFSPFHQEGSFSRFVNARCTSTGASKTTWSCNTITRNQFLSPIRQLKIKFDEDISDKDAAEILSIIDESSDLWPQKCSIDNANYFAPYIHSVAYNGENFEVSFCQTASTKSVLFIGRDMNDLKLFPITVKTRPSVD